jgi:hypothetical protein
MMKRRGKPDGSGARSVLGCLLAPVAYIVAPAAAYFLTYHAMERVVLTILYGEARYAAGLRIVNHFFLLSDGTTLPGKGRVFLILVPFLMVVAVVALGHLLVAWSSGDVNAMTTKRD